ncbi:MAG: hypothetical protein KJI70_00565 [Patescibacteria group bacterium]|nr:hypothetical protein [Patescibacteria group bacterium]
MKEKTKEDIFIEQLQKQANQLRKTLKESPDFFEKSEISVGEALGIDVTMKMVEDQGIGMNKQEILSEFAKNHLSELSINTLNIIMLIVRGLDVGPVEKDIFLELIKQHFTL